MISKIKKIYSKQKAIILISGILTVSVLAYFSRKKSRSLKPPRFKISNQQYTSSSAKTQTEKKKEWTKHFELRLITRNSLLSLLKTLNFKLIETIVTSN
jgi:hypothetical protein